MASLSRFIRSLAPASVLWFIPAELLCLAGFVLGMYSGRSALALSFYFVPLQIMLLVALLGSDMKLLSFFAVLFPLTSVELLPDLYRELVLFVGFFGILFVLTVTGFVRGKPEAGSRLKTVERTLLAGILVAVVLSVSNALLRGWSDMPMIRSSVLMVVVVAAVWVFGVVPATVADVRLLLSLLAVAFVVACLSLPVILDAPTGFLTRKIFEGPFGRVNTNMLGMSTAAFSAVLLGMMLDSVRPRARVLLVGAAFCLIGTMVYTQSRGAWVGFGVAYCYLLLRTRSVRLLVLGTAGIVTLLSLDVFRTALVFRVEETSTQDPSLLGRFVLWSSAWRALKSNWAFGLGMENFKFLKERFGIPTFLDPWNWYHTHNMVLEIMVGLGVLGAVSFLLLQLRAFFRLDAIVRGCRTMPGRGLALGLNAGALCYAVHGLLDSPTHYAPTFLWWGVIVGLSLAVSRMLGDCAYAAGESGR